MPIHMRKITESAASHKRRAFEDRDAASSVRHLPSPLGRPLEKTLALRRRKALALEAKTQAPPDIHPMTFR